MDACRANLTKARFKTVLVLGHIRHVRSRNNLDVEG